eukprot:189854_1
MSDKFGANNVSLVAPDPKTTYPIVLGKSFFQQQNRRRPTGFVSATYRFKPSSVDQSQPGNISFDKTTATLQFERRNNAHTNNANRKIKFQGESKLASDREFFLWFDASSQRMVLERSGIQIKQLKHNREQNKPTNANYNDTSKDRMKHYLEKHKKKALKKNKTKTKKKSKVIIKPKPNTNNTQNHPNSDTSSTRSSSISISPYHQTAVSHPSPMNTVVNNAQFRKTQNTVNHNPLHNNNNNNHSLLNENHNGPTPLFGFNGTWNDDSDDSEDDDILIN